MSKIDYDAWKSGWYDCESSTLCKQCEKNEQTFDLARDYLKEIIGELYSTAVLDKNKLECALDELCWLLGIRTIDGEIQVDRKRAQNVFILDLIKLNNDLLKQIAQ
jgi:hypothetical protein